MSGAFLTPDNRPDPRERERERQFAEYHDEQARSSYRWATVLMVACMAVIAAPQLGVSQWNWYIVGGTALVILILSIRMMVHGRVGNGIASLICALVILPGWIYVAPEAVEAGQSFYNMLKGMWADKLG